MDKQKVYYRIAEIAKKFGMSQEQMAEILKKNGIVEVLNGIYDRDSFRGKVSNLKKMVAEYKNDMKRERITAENPDGYMNVAEIAMIFGIDENSVRRKLRLLKLPYITGIRNEKRYHDIIIDKYSHVLRKGKRLPVKNKYLRERGYIPADEFAILAGICRSTLTKRIKRGIYTDFIIVGCTSYLHRRNLNVKPTKMSSIASDSPDGYIPLITIREILGLASLSIKKYVDSGIVNNHKIIRKSGHVYIERSEAEKFISWYSKMRAGYENGRRCIEADNITVKSGIGVVLSDYKFDK